MHPISGFAESSPHSGCQTTALRSIQQGVIKFVSHIDRHPGGLNTLFGNVVNIKSIIQEQACILMRKKKYYCGSFMSWMQYV